MTQEEYRALKVGNLLQFNREAILANIKAFGRDKGIMYELLATEPYLEVRKIHETGQLDAATLTPNDNQCYFTFNQMSYVYFNKQLSIPESVGIHFSAVRK